MTFHTPIAKCILEDDILFVETLSVKRTVENIQVHYDILKEKLTTRKYWILDLTYCDNFPKTVRDIIQKELPSRCMAIALFAQKPCEKMMANYFKLMKSANLPVEVFKHSKDAKTWLKTLAKNK